MGNILRPRGPSFRPVRYAGCVNFVTFARRAYAAAGAIP